MDPNRRDSSDFLDLLELYSSTPNMSHRNTLGAPFIHKRISSLSHLSVSHAEGMRISTLSSNHTISRISELSDGPPASPVDSTAPILILAEPNAASWMDLSEGDEPKNNRIVQTFKRLTKRFSKKQSF
jgi:hypothetical protein